MAWGSGYAQPSDWQTRKRVVLDRDEYRCYLQLPGVCTGEAITADHIVPRSQGGSDEYENLAAICGPCHKVKTEQERQQGMRHRVRTPMKRNVEDHPNRPRA